MKTLISFISIWACCFYSAQSQSYVWANSTGSQSFSSEIQPTAMALDASNNVYTIGTFTGTVDFNPGVGVANLTSSSQNYDTYIQKLDANGNFVSAISLAGNGYTSGQAIETDANGNVYIVGSFDSPVDFDPGATVNSISPLGNQDAFILKLNSSGMFQWVKTFGSANFVSCSALSLAIDNNNDIILSGFFADVVDFNPGPAVNALGATGFADQFILKLNSAGNFVWAKAFLGSDYINPYQLTTDANNNIFSSGTFYGTYDFDPGIGQTNLSASQTDDIYITKLNSNGDFIWAKKLGNNNYENVEGLVTDQAGNTYITATFIDTLDTDPGANIVNLITQNDAILILKLNSSGNFVWSKKIDGNGYTYPENIDINNQGHIYLTGYFDGVADFDPGNSVYNLTSAGDYDIFISKYDENGNFILAKNIGDISADGGFDMKVATNGSIYVTGLFGGTVDFNPGPATNNLTSISASGFDQFNFKWDMCNPSTTNLTAYHCNSFTLNGQTYTSSGTYTQTFQSASGCDSLVNLALTIGSTNSVINQVQCNGTPFVFNGQTYSTAGTYTQYYTNVAGCDSNYTINLSFGAPTTSSISVTTCDYYLFGNQPLFNSGIYTQVFPNASGCDSTVTLNLTINNSVFNYSFVSNCGPYVFNNQTFTTTGFYSFYYTSAQGCDSVIDIDLEIKEPTSSTQTVSACQSYVFNGQTYTSSGTYTSIIPNSIGCDSTITLNLTIVSPNIAVSQAGAVLTSAATSPATYQWIDCSTNSPITGATNQSYTATANGSYAVIITINSCSDTSTCRPVTGIGIDEINSLNGIMIYPNPTTSKLNIDLNQTVANSKIEIRSVAGQLLYTNEAIKSNTIEVPVSEWANGMYFISFYTQDKKWVGKFMKE
jgi:hypothetical protein